VSAYDSLARYYDELTTDVDYNAFADYYEAIFRRLKINVKTVLDLACGTGSLSCVLAERGYELISVDGSEDMLSEAAEKFARLEGVVPPLTLNQRMEELDLYGTVDAEICMLDGMNYLDPDELRETVRRLWLFQEPGGVLIFDVNTPFKLRSLDGQVFIDEREDVYCVWRSEFDEDENVCCYGMDIFSALDNGLWERSLEEHFEYAYSQSELEDILRNAGFTDIEVFGELTFDRPHEDEGRIFIIARKPKEVK
jgi:SAM-dependent methyltransferase